MVGRVIGHYQIQAEIGSGGMGVVYRAWDAHLRRHVALKLLPPQAIANMVSRRRLRREALALSRLNHPSVTTLYDFISEPDCDCIVMELVAGESLDRRLDRGALPEDEALRLAIQLVDGLSAAHQAGVIHRDLKPANLRVTPDGRLKILDFGLARREILSGDSTTAMSTESAGVVAGTMPYIAPEVWKGEAATEASDLYSFGVVLYEMVTGSRPFPDVVGGAIPHATMHATPPNPRTRNPAVSPELDAVVMRCLEKDPAARHASAKELQAELETLQSRQTQGIAGVARPSWRRRLPTAVTLAASVVLLAFVLWQRLPGGGSAEAQVRSLGVLPFANLSGDRDQDFVADGVTDALISKLGELPSTRVISRTSMMRYKNTTKALPDIASELGVDHVIQGSVVIREERVRISVQLIEGRTDRQVWGRQFEGDPDELLDIQGRLAEGVAREMGLDPRAGSGRPGAGSRADPTAYQLYLQGRFHLDRRNEDGIRRAISCFTDAIGHDSLYALPYTGLANAWSAAAFTGIMRPAEAYPRAKTAALQALALDPGLSESHASLGNILQNNDWDWDGAARAYRRAIELNDNNAVAHHWYAYNLALRGEFVEAMAELRKARDLDPYSLPIGVAGGAFLYFARRHDEARKEFDRVAPLDSTSGMLQRAIAANYDRLGREAEAARAVVRWLASTQPGDFSERVARAYAERGMAAMLRLLIQGLVAKRDAGLYEPATHVAELYARLGEREAAFEWLTVALSERDTELNRLRVDPIFDPLRGDPRFDALLRQVGLAGPTAGRS